MKNRITAGMLLIGLLLIIAFFYSEFSPKNTSSLNQNDDEVNINQSPKSTHLKTDSITRIILAAPGDEKGFDWPVITLKGKGLYNKIYNYVFGLKNITVNFSPYPTLRCKSNVAKGHADFFPGGIKNENFQGYSFITPQYAIWQ